MVQAATCKTSVGLNCFLSARAGHKNPDAQLRCTGWRDISNNTGQYPAERITINNDFAEKVPRTFPLCTFGNKKKKRKVKKMRKNLEQE